jgi:hypothetical protein
MRDKGKAPPPSIFLCYRRDDSADVTGRIFDRLAQDFGEDRVFMDAESMDSGINFRTRVHKVLSECRVALVIIGPSWITIRDEKTGQRRLDEEEDNVRFEVETALSRPDVHIIPVRVNKAPWPLKKELPESIRALADLNGPEVRRNPDFKHDMAKLVSEIGKYVPRKSRVLRSLLSWAITALILGLLGWSLDLAWFTERVKASDFNSDSNKQMKEETVTLPAPPPVPVEAPAAKEITPAPPSPTQPTPQVDANPPTLPSTTQTRSKSRFKPIEDNSPVVSSPSTIPVYQYHEPRNRPLKPAEPSTK